MSEEQRPEPRPDRRCPTGRRTLPTLILWFSTGMLMVSWTSLLPLTWKTIWGYFALFGLTAAIGLGTRSAGDVAGNWLGRTWFIRRLRRSVRRAKQDPKYVFAVLLLDLDRFEHVNSSLGYAAGDELLVAVAERLRRCLRARDVVTRLAGDQFAILADGIQEPNRATEIAQRVRAQLGEPFRIHGEELFISASIGITVSTTKNEGPDDLLRDAHASMRQAKSNGRARFEVFDAIRGKQSWQPFHLEKALRQAGKRNEFSLHYQPIVKLESGKIKGFEALIRWTHPERGAVAPLKFLPVAQETGLITALGAWALREACSQMALWHARCGTDSRLYISVNFSPTQLQPDLVELVDQVLRDTRLDPRCLMVEVTENVLAEDAQRVSKVLLQLEKRGLWLAIDDFSVGHSSVKYLQQFPFDTLKIDRSIVQNADRNVTNAEILRSILHLGHTLGMRVIAEGIETDAELEFLRIAGCRYGQGYLLSRPMTADAAGEYLARHLPWDTAVLHPEAKREFVSSCKPAPLDALDVGVAVH